MLIIIQVTGFTDVAPLIREQTVKAVLTVVPKLSDRIVNGELLRYLAKTANDEQPGIRTNTTICLGKIARNLGAGVCPSRVELFYGISNAVTEPGEGPCCRILTVLTGPIRACT